MDDTRLFLTYLYSFTHLPLCYYEDGSLAFCVPAAAVDYAPPEQYRNAFCSFDYLVSWQTADFGGFYGYVRWKNKNAFCILGPATPVFYDNSTLFSMRREFHIKESETQAFLHFLKGISCRTVNEFVSELCFLNFSVNREEAVPHDLQNIVSIPDDDTVSRRLVHQEITDKEADRVNNSLDVERRLIRLVENGDLDELRDFLHSSVMVNSGTVANTSLRNEKNLFIIETTIYCRAAIRGGLPPELAFHLSDSYIQQVETLTNADAVHTLSQRMLVDYTMRVSRHKTERHEDPVLQKAIYFVHHHTNARITVSDVADYVGFSRGYLSTLFKEQLGFDLSAFIRRCKLEEAKELLRYSDKSISEISSYLCFSSQSHFQNCFKKQYKITPQQYRRGAKVR